VPFRFGIKHNSIPCRQQSLLNPCNLVTPTIDDLRECSNKDKVNAINNPPANGAVTYPGSASFFAAPWLVSTIMDAGTSDYFKLIPAINAAAIKFYAKNKNDAEYTTSASNHKGDFILWAWGAGTGQVSPTKMTFNQMTTTSTVSKMNGTNIASPSLG
jgi:hypothetical protein